MSTLNVDKVAPPGSTTGITFQDDGSRIDGGFIHEIDQFYLQSNDTQDGDDNVLSDWVRNDKTGFTKVGDADQRAAYNALTFDDKQRIQGTYQKDPFSSGDDEEARDKAYYAYKRAAGGSGAKNARAESFMGGSQYEDTKARAAAGADIDMSVYNQQLQGKNVNGVTVVGYTDTSGNFVQFNGTQIIIKSPDFFLGDATNFISGSNGDMHKGFDHELFAAQCCNSEQKCMITYNSDLYVKERFPKWKQKDWELTYTMRSTGNYNKNQKKRKELLLLNY